MRQHRLVGRLLVQQEDQVVPARHLLGGQGLDGYEQIHFPDDARAVAIQGLDMGAVGIDQMDRPPAFRHQAPMMVPSDPAPMIAVLMRSLP